MTTDKKAKITFKFVCHQFNTDVNKAQIAFQKPNGIYRVSQKKFTIFGFFVQLSIKVTLMSLNVYDYAKDS